MMKKIHIMVGLLLTLMVAMPLAAFAQESATIQSIKGKVEILVNGRWTAARQGQAIPLGGTISTGFRSEAILALGRATLTARAMSRITIRELAISAGLISKGDVVLQVGRVRAELPPAGNIRQPLTIKSPVATASVRGTIFEFDGETVTVEKGVVSFETPSGDNISVGQGESAESSADGSGVDNQELLTIASDVNTRQGEDQSDSGDTSRVTDDIVNNLRFGKATVVITIR